MCGLGRLQAQGAQEKGVVHGLLLQAVEAAGLGKVARGHVHVAEYMLGAGIAQDLGVLERLPIGHTRVVQAGLRGGGGG